jgi:hypothetical protein
MVRRSRSNVRWAAAGLALLILVSCAGNSPGPSKPGSSIPLKGTLLGTGQRFGLGLVAYSVPDLKGRPFRPPEPPSDAGSGDVTFYQPEPSAGAYWAGDTGSAFSFVGLGGVRARLFQLSTDGDPRPLGGPLSFVSSFDVRASTALTATCPVAYGGQSPGHVQVIGVDGTAGWREVARSCVATLSPDGKIVAYVHGDTEVWEEPVGGGAPTKLLDVSSIPEVHDAQIGRRLTVVQVSWGQGGLAAVVADARNLGQGQGRMAVVVRDPAGAVRMVAIPAQELSLPYRPWQPAGSLMAIICRPTSGGAVVRLFDAKTGEVRVVATDAQYFGDTVWSPDGRALVANTSNNALVFFDPQGNRIKRVGGGGVGLLDWRA